MTCIATHGCACVAYQAHTFFGINFNQGWGLVAAAATMSISMMLLLFAGYYILENIE